MAQKWTFPAMFGQLLLSLATLGFVGGVSLLVWQGYWFLDSGAWPHLSVITALRYYNVAWAFAPTTWKGLYIVCEHCPLSVAILILGCLPLVLACVAALAEDNYRKKHR